jgi:hypothetical protein
MLMPYKGFISLSKELLPIKAHKFIINKLSFPTKQAFMGPASNNLLYQQILYKPRSFGLRITL